MLLPLPSVRSATAAVGQIKLSENIRTFQATTREPRRRLSSTTEAEVGDAAADLLRAPFTKVAKTPNVTLFPWRHEEALLPRVERGQEKLVTNDKSSNGNPVMSVPQLKLSIPRRQAFALSMSMLEVPFWIRVFFSTDWQEETAQDMSWAFLQGVRHGIIRNVYEVPDESVKWDEDTSTLDMHHTFEANQMRDIDGKRTENGGKTGSSDMLEPKLRSLFESAHEFGKEHLEIQLKTTLVDSYMAFTGFLPFVTRGNTEDALEYFDTEAPAPVSSYLDMKRLWATYNDNTFRSTIVVQVLVVCDEVFYVKDTSTDTIIQGSLGPSPRRVCHLVRFERVVESFYELGPGHTPIGNWQMTDIDDLLDGNPIL